MADPVAGYVAGQLGRLAQREAKKPRAAQVIPPSEQIRRFLSGAEMARVQSGEITPAQFAEYEQQMVAYLSEVGALNTGG